MTSPASLHWNHRIQPDRPTDQKSGADHEKAVRTITRTEPTHRRLRKPSRGYDAKSQGVRSAHSEARARVKSFQNAFTNRLDEAEESLAEQWRELDEAFTAQVTHAQHNMDERRMPLIWRGPRHRRMTRKLMPRLLPSLLAGLRLKQRRRWSRPKKRARVLSPWRKLRKFVSPLVDHSARGQSLSPMIGPVPL